MRARYVNEVFSFERSSSDPLKNLSVGKRVQIVKWLDSFGITNYTINDDLTIDVKGDVELDHKSLTCFPSFIKFNKVSGYFDCANNQLTSLEGCPTIVGGSFYSSRNQLISLEGCPATVGGGFYCHDNNKQFSEEYVRSLCKVKEDIYV
jgi:hypothetical protein